MPLGPTSWGGVLLDSHGRVLGILDGQMSLGNDTIGLFVPAPLAEGVALELATTHRVDHGWLGVKCVDPLATSANPTARGAEVAAILPGSPALKAGLEPGDVVMAVGDPPRGLRRRSPGAPLHGGTGDHRAAPRGTGQRPDRRGSHLGRLIRRLTGNLGAGADRVR